MVHWLFKLLVLLSILFTHGYAGAQTANESLYEEIKKIDSLVFDAFNKRDVKAFGQFFSQDLEFYHDKGGLTGYKHTMNFMKSTAEGNSGVRRSLVDASLEVYPIKDFGAMQIGSHSFCLPQNGKTECGTYRFMHIWKKTPEGWKITRVVSYGH